MHKFAILVLVAAWTALAGCAGTGATVRSRYELAQGEKLSLQLVTPPTATQEGAKILRERLTAQLAQNNVLALGASTRTLEVTVTNYRIRHGATRAMVGIMAGADNVQSSVKLKDADGKVLSDFSVESKNPTAWGTTKGLLEEHADKIVDTLLHGGK